MPCLKQQDGQHNTHQACTAPCLRDNKKTAWHGAGNARNSCVMCCFHGASQGQQQLLELVASPFACRRPAFPHSQQERVSRDAILHGLETGRNRLTVYNNLKTRLEHQGWLSKVINQSSRIHRASPRPCAGPLKARPISRAWLKSLSSHARSEIQLAALKALQSG